LIVTLSRKKRRKRSEVQDTTKESYYLSRPLTITENDGEMSVTMKELMTFDVIVDTANRNMAIEFVDEEILHKIVVREGAKGYHHKSVDEDNDDGFFRAYKQLCSKIAAIISEVKPAFPYPKILASTLIETANNNLYFARHLPRLTDLQTGKHKDDLNQQVKEMLAFFCFGLIENEEIKERSENGKPSAGR